MTIGEVNKALNNKSMQKNQTNFKVYKNGGSNITVKEFYEEFKEFVKEQRKFNHEQQKFNQFVHNMFKQHKWIK